MSCFSEPVVLIAYIIPAGITYGLLLAAKYNERFARRISYNNTKEFCYVAGLVPVANWVSTVELLVEFLTN